MSYPQQPLPGHSNPIGDPATPVAGMVGQPPHLSPPPVTGPPFQASGGGRTLPPSRPVGIIIGAIGMFAIGLAYLVVIVLNLFSLIQNWELLDRQSAFLVSELMVVMTYLIIVLVAAVGGVLLLMNKPIARVLSFVVVGGVLLVACQAASREAVWLFAYGGRGPWVMQALFVVLNLALLIVSVAVVVMLAPRRVEEWLRNPAPPAAAGFSPPVQQPIGQASMAQQPPQQPTAMQPPPGQPYSVPPTTTDHQPPQPPA